MALRAELVARWLLDRCLRASPAAPDVAAIRLRCAALSAWQAMLARAARRDKAPGIPALHLATVAPGRLAVVGEPVAAPSDLFSRELHHALRNASATVDAGGDLLPMLASVTAVSTSAIAPIPSRASDALTHSGSTALAADLFALANRLGVAPALAAALLRCSAPAVTPAPMTVKNSEAVLAAPDKPAATATKPTSAGKGTKTSAPAPSAAATVPTDALVLGAGGSLALKPDLLYAFLLVAQWQIAGVTGSSPAPTPPVAAPSATNSRAGSGAASSLGSAATAPAPAAAASDISQRIFLFWRALVPSIDACKPPALSAEVHRTLLALSSHSRSWGYSDETQTAAALALYPPDGSDVGKYRLARKYLIRSHDIAFVVQASLSRSPLFVLLLCWL